MSESRFRPGCEKAKTDREAPPTVGRNGCDLYGILLRSWLGYTASFSAAVPSLDGEGGYLSISGYEHRLDSKHCRIGRVEPHLDPMDIVLREYFDSIEVSD